MQGKRDDGGKAAVYLTEHMKNPHKKVQIQDAYFHGNGSVNLCCHKCFY